MQGNGSSAFLGQPDSLTGPALTLRQQVSYENLPPFDNGTSPLFLGKRITLSSVELTQWLPADYAAYASGRMKASLHQEFGGVTPADAYLELRGSADADADISLLGNWDLQNGQVTFVTNVNGTAAGTAFSVAVAGKLKGVAAGFEFSTAGGTPQVLFTIQGKIIGTDASGYWQLSLGYADKRLSASLQGAATYKVGSNVIGITGNLQIGSSAGAGYTLALDLKTQWTLANGQFNFTISGGNGTYALALSGDLKIDALWNVSFAIACNANGATFLSLSLANAAVPGSPMNANLKLFFDTNKKTFGASISLTLNFVAGTLVP